MEIIFKNYNLDDNLDLFNIVLARASKDRFELRQSKTGVYYLYDFDDKEIIRNKEEIIDIIGCQNIEEFTSKENYLRIKQFLTL